MMKEEDPNTILITYKSKRMFAEELKHMQSSYGSKIRSGINCNDDFCFVVFTESSIMNEDATEMQPIIRLLFLQTPDAPKCLGEIVAVIRAPNIEDGKAIRNYYQKKLLSYALDLEEPNDIIYGVNCGYIKNLLEGTKIIRIGNNI